MVLKTPSKIASLFGLLIRDWNDLLDLMISSSEWTDDNVSKFIFLVRASEIFPPVTPIVKDCHFGVSPVSSKTVRIYNLFVAKDKV